MKAYNTSLRRGVKWYRKLAIELIAGASFVNAYLLHQEITKNKMSITKFREKVIAGLIKHEESPRNFEEPSHVLNDTGKRQICSECYRENVLLYGRTTAKNRTPKTKTRCLVCEKNLCLECFFKLHSFNKLITV